MGIPIGELQVRVSSREFAEYWAFQQLEPFGPERDDLRAGIVASTIANANRDKKKRPRPFTADEFAVWRMLPDGLTEDDLPDDEELAARIDQVMAELGGTETP